MECVACSLEITQGQQLKCNLCYGNYHYQCLNMDRATYLENKATHETTWRCEDCSNITRRRRGDDTPVRKLHEPKELDIVSDEQPLNYQPNNTVSPLPPTLAQISGLLDRKLSSHHNAISKNLAEVRNEFQLSIIGLTGQLATLNTRLEALEKENAMLKLKLQSSEGSQEIGDGELNTFIAQLKAELNDKEQEHLLNDIEITGLPEYDKESTEHLAIAVAAKLGLALEERDVVSCARAGPRRLIATSSEGAALRPRPLVVRLARRATRNLFLIKARTHRETTTEGIGLPIHKHVKIYINERLTKQNRTLLGKTREANKTCLWKYVWTRDGRILARKEDKATVFQIRSVVDIERVFGISPVEPKQ